jgi:chorismate synthase
MAGNTFGQIFRVTTFGESHGPAIGVVLDGVPPGIPLKEADIQFDLDRRRPGQSKITTQRKESDRAEILSGVFDGQTTGTALALLIRNEDQRGKDYSDIKDKFRPGHADYTFFAKYGIRDYRGGGRSSGRETACRVAAGAVARKVLSAQGVTIAGYTLSVGDIVAKKRDFAFIDKNIARTCDPDVAEAMIARIDEARRNLDSVGGIVEAVIHGCPPGLGDPVFDKINAKLAYGLMSIGAVRGVEFGLGFAATAMEGSRHNDRFYMDGDRVRTLTNNAGGMLGGITNGEDIVLRVAVKPVSSLARPQQTVTETGETTTIETKGRHDPCICPRIVPVVEAMCAITVLDALLIQKSIRPESVPPGRA